MANHRSIREEQELLLIPAYDQTRPVVPVAAVFGANASGKSNLIGALRWMQDAVLRSYRSWEPEGGVPRRPYRLDAESPVGQSTFTVEVSIDGILHQYGFAVDDETILSEWLHTFPHNRTRVLFERTRDQVELGSKIPDRRTRSELLSGLLRENSLLLSVAVQAGQDEVLPMYRWFRSGLRFSGASVTALTLAEQVQVAVRRFPSFVDLIKVADLGISGVLVVETEVQPSAVEKVRPRLVMPTSPQTRQLKSPVRRELIFLHGADQVALAPEDQSDGTIAWTQLLIHTMESLDAGAVLVVDEVDASLHPRLTARLIELFRNPATNERGAQLVFSTHDATLLGTNLGEDVLKRDEIWFIEKQDGASKLYPLSDFHPRSGENRERRYLAGSYGAVPSIFEDSLVESLLASRVEDADAEA